MPRLFSFLGLLLIRCKFFALGLASGALSFVIIVIIRKIRLDINHIAKVRPRPFPVPQCL